MNINRFTFFPYFFEYFLYFCFHSFLCKLCKFGWTALIVSAKRGYIDQVIALLERNADIEAKDDVKYDDISYC